jgi:hypothetical protein
MSTRSFLPVALVCLSFAVAACDVKVGEGGLSFDVAQGKAAEDWTRTYTLAANGRLEITSANGAIEAFPSTGPQVEIAIHRDARANTDEAAQAVLKDLPITEEVSPSLVRVFSEPPNKSPAMFGRRSIRVQFRVGIPEGLEVVLKGDNGPIRVQNVKSRLTLVSTNGGVTVSGASGTLDAQTVNGSVNVDMATVTGDIKVATVNGGIRIEVPSGTNATVEAHAVNGGVSVDEGLNLTATQQERQHIVGRINAGGAKISAQTVNGGVRIRATGSGR